jgi:predicted RNase H-like HicB family nuclease
MPQYRYTAFFEPLPDGGFNVRFPAIPEICTFGATLAEARTMAADALRCYVTSALELGEPLPPDVEPAREPIAVSV